MIWIKETIMSIVYKPAHVLHFNYTLLSAMIYRGFRVLGLKPKYKHDKRNSTTISHAIVDE